MFLQQNWHYPGPLNGSMFMTSQGGYLRGVHCDTTEVHFVCQERFDDDWRSLLRIFGVRSSSARNGTWRRHVRSETESLATPSTRSTRRMTREKKARETAIIAHRNSALSEADKDFIRNVLYPWDTNLHKWACRKGTTQNKK